MIARLRGLVDQTDADGVVIDVGGVGYLVFCSGQTRSRLPAKGEAATLLIETHMREDHIHLYGFADEAERDWFRLLTTVQGVGTKVALAILTALDLDDLAHSIAAQDKAGLTRAAGVGPRLATRIASELKDKVGALTLGPAAAALAEGGAEGADRTTTDAVSALVHLGYRPADAFGAVARARRGLGEAPALDDLVRAGLRELTSGEVSR